MLVNIKTLIDGAQCYETVRELRWPKGRQCPFCDSKRVIKRGFDYLTGTIFAGRHQPLKVWILCLYFMGLNLSNKQIARELDLDRTDVQKMTTQLRDGVVKKSLL